MADAAKPDAPAKYEPPRELEGKAQVQKFMGRPKRTPADQAEYFYNVKVTHVVFFAASLGLLAAFLLMFRKDHVRPWKEYQRQFAEMDFEKLWFEMNELRKAEAAHDEKKRELERQIEAFLKVFRGRTVPVTLFDPAAPEKVARLKTAPTVTVLVDEEKRKLSLVEQEKIRGEHYDRQQLFNFAKDELGAARYRFEEAGRHYEEARRSGSGRLPEYERQYLEAKKAWEQVNAKVDLRKREFDEVDALKTFYEDFVTALETRPVPGLWEGRPALADLQREIALITRDLEDKRTRFQKERPSFANRVRNLPVLDFFAPQYKVQQVILPDLKDQLNFTRVDKVDRCHTCHVGIANPVYEVRVHRSAEKEEDRYVFKDPFLREFVAHARGLKDGRPFEPRDCKVCDPDGRRGTEVPAPLTPHGSWDSDDAVRFTKAFMAHPRLDLYVADSSRHPMQRFGCTICHEGDGRDTDFTRVVHTPDDRREAAAWRRRHGTPYGEERYNWKYRELWDLPMIPSKFAQASCRRCHVDAVELDGAEKYVAGMKLFERAGCYGCHRTDTYQVLEKDQANPSLDPNRKARRPGPPLTRIDTKITPEWAWKWVMSPRDFRPATRMPHFFLQSNARNSVTGLDEKGEVRKKPYKPEEIDGTIAWSILRYVWSLSETKEDDPPPAGLKGDAKRGELIVRQVGCTACHKVEDTPESEFRAWTDRSRYLEEFAPSLAGVGSKIKSKTWLYHWVRDPKKYFPDSSMPRLRLTEQEALDVVEYLMTLRKPEWERRPGPPPVREELVNDLVFEQLRKSMPDADARRALRGENPELKDLDGRVRWLGRKMTANFGCYSCHELPRKEGEPDWRNTEGIGVELTGAQPFGSKHYDRLDFGFTMDDGVNHHGVTFKHGVTGQEITARVHETRQDWLEWKLRNPRIFDGGKMESKPWDELLRMPNFGFTDYEIELLQTFVLSFTDHRVAGLVALAEKQYSPDERALNRGERIVRDSNCRACHRMSLDRFEMEWTRPDPSGKKVLTSWEWVEGRNLGRASADNAEGILRRWGLISGDVTKEQLARYEVYSIDWASHHRTLRIPGVVAGGNKFVVFDGDDGWYLDTDEKGQPLKRPIRRRIPQDGGDILPQIAAFKKKLADESDEDIGDMSDPGQLEARYPPMLRTQGVKTQVDWLYRFLKEPWPIRPNIFPLAPGAKTMPDLNIRMPTFGFTDEEAASLVRWFAVRDHLPGVDVYPHTNFPERDPALLAARKEIHEKVLRGVILDREKGCASCHWVAGQAPPGDPFKHAPDLAHVEERLRPRWLYSWVAVPAAIYPRTTMTSFWSNPADPRQADEIRAAVEALLNFRNLTSATGAESKEKK